jgi:GAF domain-containing protein
VVCVDVSEAAERYPAFAEEAAELGIHSFLAAPLIAGEGALGSLNLYSRSVAGFDALDETLVALFVGQASVAVANARVYAATRRLSEQLADAMASRAVIEQAKGVLIARQGGDEDTAFARLRERSQRSNIKLHEVARQIVAEAGGNGVGASHDV